MSSAGQHCRLARASPLDRNARFLRYRNGAWPIILQEGPLRKRLLRGYRVRKRRSKPERVGGSSRHTAQRVGP
jgi:hypothetical protein